MSSSREIIYNTDLQLWLFWDARERQYYYYDHRDDRLVYNDKRRVPRPHGVLPNHYLNPYGQQPSHSPPSLPAHDYSGSPTNDGSYVTGPPQSSPLQTPWTGYSSQSPGESSLIAAMNSISMQDAIPQPVQPHVYDNHGLRTVHAQDQRSQVQTLFATAPAERISDPVLYAKGVHSHRMLLGIPGPEREVLFPGFSVRKPGHKFFVVGRVFLVLWVEPAGESQTMITAMENTDNPAISVGRFNEKIFSKVRRFVVIRAGPNFCSALPIVSYGRRGVGKHGVQKSDHAIIYTDTLPPRQLETERPIKGEKGMRPRALRVVPDDKDRDKLDIYSRIDFGKVHTIQHNIKVKAFGMIHPGSEPDLKTQFNAVWNREVIPETHDEDDEEDENDEAASVGKGKAPAHTRTFSSASRSSSSSVSPTSAQAKAAYKRMLDKGFTAENALYSMVATMVTQNPGITEDYADDHIRRLIWPKD